LSCGVDNFRSRNITRRRNFNMKTTLSAAILFCVLVTTPVIPAAAEEGTPARESVLIFEPDYFSAASPTTARDMVNRLPGFRMEDGDSVRGFEGAGGNILINGARPASKSDRGSDILQRTPASRVERVELIRGGAPGIDMQGQTVVVNVILRNEVSRQHTTIGQAFAFEGGPFLSGGRYEFNTTGNGRQWGFTLARTVSLNDSKGHGKSLRFDTDGGLILMEEIDSSFDGGGWSGRGNWSGPLIGGRVELTVGANSHVYTDWLGYSPVYSAPPALASSSRRFDLDEENGSLDLGLRYERDLASGTRLEARLIQNRGSSEFLNAARSDAGVQLFDTERETGESIARLMLKRELHSGLSLEGGTELAFNFLDTEQSFTVDGASIALPQATTRVEELRGELFGRTTWQYSETLVFEAGLRLERSQIEQSGDGSAERRFFYPKPRVTGTWTPIEGHQYRLRFQRELGQLNFQDFAASSSLSNEEVRGGNVNLRPQQRWISEAVYERRFSEDAVLTLTLRHDEIKDVIDVLPLEGGHTAIGNIGDGTLDRAAINLRLPLGWAGDPLEGARVTLSARYDRTRVVDPTSGQTRQISRVRPVTGDIRFEQDLPQYRITWGVDYTPRWEEQIFDPDQLRMVALKHFASVFLERAFSDTFNVRVQYTKWDDFRIGRDVFADRDAQQIDFTERQRIVPRDYIQLRVRKTFG
jgi:hypothetical protein